MDKVKIKPPGAPTEEAREILLKAIQDLGVDVAKLATLPDGFLAIPLTAKDCRNLIKISNVDKLKEKQYQVITPMSVNARKTLIIRDVDKYVTNKSKERLEQEIRQKNGGLVVQDIIIIPRFNIIKLKFDTVEIAERVKKNGIKFECISINPDQIEHEEFVPITQCFNCYTYAHPTHKCTYKHKLTWCSECGSRSHTYRQCDNPTVKQCLNCQGPHRTMANACQQRKQAIATQRKVNRENEINKQNKPLREMAKLAAQAVSVEAASTWRDIAARQPLTTAHPSPPKIFLHIPHHISTIYATIVSVAHQLHLINPDKPFRQIVHDLCIDQGVAPLDVGQNSPTPNWGVLQLINPSQPPPNPPRNPDPTSQPSFHHPPPPLLPNRPALLDTPPHYPTYHRHPQPNQQPRPLLTQPRPLFPQPTTSQPRPLLPAPNTQAKPTPPTAPPLGLNLTQATPSTTQQNTPPITTPPTLSSTDLLCPTTFPNLDTPSHHDPLHQPIDTSIPSSRPIPQLPHKDRPIPNLPTTTQTRPQTPKRKRGKTEPELDLATFLSPAQRHKRSPRHKNKTEKPLTAKQLYPNMTHIDDKTDETHTMDMDIQTPSTSHNHTHLNAHRLTNAPTQNAHTTPYRTCPNPPPPTTTPHPSPAPGLITSPIASPTAAPSLPPTSSPLVIASPSLTQPLPTYTDPHTLPIPPTTRIPLPNTSHHTTPSSLPIRLSSLPTTTNMTALTDAHTNTTQTNTTTLYQTPRQTDITTTIDITDSDRTDNEMTNIKERKDKKNSIAYTITTPKPQRVMYIRPNKTRRRTTSLNQQDTKQESFATPNPPSRTHSLPPQPDKTPSRPIPKQQSHKQRTPSTSSTHSLGHEHALEQQISKITSPKGPVQHSPPQHQLHPAPPNSRTPTGGARTKHPVTPSPARTHKSKQ